MARLLAGFVPVADEVGRLQRGKDPECRFFQSFAEEGHYGGRTEPSNTRQGIYAVAPSGKFLASINTRSPADLAGMLERALAAWSALPREQRLLPSDPSVDLATSRRHEARFPAGGVALRVTARDLPRAAGAAGEASDWRRAAWNEDWAWAKPEELLALCAPQPALTVGATWSVAGDLPRRLARAQLLDFVRGQTLAFKSEEVERVELRVTVEALEEGIARLRLDGASRTSATGRWKINGFAPTTEEQTRGLELTWLGFASWDMERKRLTQLELLATGTRWGATQFNGRADDLGPAPIAFHLALADPSRDPLVAPAQISSYGW